MHILDEELYQAGMAVAACPTAPCHEGHVRACLEERLAGLPHVTVRRDEFGNLHAAYDHDSAGREPFRLVAHMDHPGFVVKEGELHFAGGVEEKYFAGEKDRFPSRERPRAARPRRRPPRRFFGGNKTGRDRRHHPLLPPPLRSGTCLTCLRPAAPSGFFSARPATISPRSPPSWRSCGGWPWAARGPASTPSSPARRRSVSPAPSPR